jgi:hypothetical protein
LVNTGDELPDNVETSKSVNSRQGQIILSPRSRRLDATHVYNDLSKDIIALATVPDDVDDIRQIFQCRRLTANF